MQLPKGASLVLTRWCVNWQVLLRYPLVSAQHVGKVRGVLGLCDIISSPHMFHVASSFIFKSIQIVWRALQGLVRWNTTSNIAGWDLVRHLVWSWWLHNSCIAELPCFQAQYLSKRGIIFWKNIWDPMMYSLKDWQSLLPFDQPSISKLIGLIPWKDETNTLEWIFGHPLQQYDSQKLYVILHQSHRLAPILNVHWVSSNPKDRQVH